MRLSLRPSSLLLLPLQWGSVVWSRAQGVAADLPNPCTTLGFRTPVYRISNFTLSVQPIRDIPKLEVVDEANNYSTQCNWVADPNNYNFDPKPDEYAVFCDLKILQGYPAASGWYDVVKNSLNVTQWWVCDALDGSYPTRIEAFATIKFPKPLSCPNCTIAESRRSESCASQTCSIADLDIPTAVATIEYPPKPTGDPDGVPRTPPGTGRDQPSSVPDNETPCIGTSFSYPNWDVTDLDSLAGGKTFTFKLRNHVLDASIQCTARNSGEVTCEDGAATKTNGSFDAQSSELSIEQAWTCSIPGDSKKFAFSASGKGVLTSNHGAQIIRGTLTKPLNFKPNVYIAASQSPNCRKLSAQGPSFDILANTQQWSLGYFTVSGHYGDVVFDLTNNANGLSMHCEVKHAPELNNCTTVSELKWYDCYPPDSGQFGREQGPVTRFTYNVTSQEIVIDQTWYCNEDETQPVKFNVRTRPTALPLRTRRVSFSSLPYNTSEELEVRCRLPTLWHLNQGIYIYGEMDKPFTIPNVPKESVNSTTLSPYSISERKPTGHSCTIASAMAPRLEVGTLTLTTGWNSIRPISNSREYTGIYADARLIDIRHSAWPEVTWSVFSSDSQSLVPGSGRTNYTQWYPCPAFTIISPMTACTWTVDFEAGWLAINTSWVCNDKDLNKPIEFKSTSSTTFNKTCSYSYDQSTARSTVNCKTELASHTLYPQYVINNASGVSTTYTDDGTLIPASLLV
ncbi:hypothetical protein QBC37DRAFT_457389 [Rhypophila decipiens]|uniref:Uncharacterized protein n=1 Tax=Rhypophila decipiens TaxID=261697 RepID=A0AAN6XWI5_9PEZI|nr:hypothetical protein QBC37DRAFT_457389 [Rhypophila decipiens]